MLGTSIGVNTFEDAALGNAGISSAVQLSVTFYGPQDFPNQNTDLVAAGCAETLGGSIGNVIDCQPAEFTTPSCADRLVEVSPVTHVNGNEPPFMIFQGTADCTVAYGQAQRLSDALTKVGVENELILVEGGEHTFGSVINGNYVRLRNFLDRHMMAQDTVSTQSPTETQRPTQTQSPTETQRPTQTQGPTETQRQVQTQRPTQTQRPSQTQSPRQMSSVEPSKAPTLPPTDAPSASPSNAPTQSPTNAPSSEPTITVRRPRAERPRSGIATASPTRSPTDAPTAEKFILKVKGIRGDTSESSSDKANAQKGMVADKTNYTLNRLKNAEEASEQTEG